MMNINRELFGGDHQGGIVVSRASARNSSETGGRIGESACARTALLHEKGTTAFSRGRRGDKRGNPPSSSQSEGKK